MPPRAVIQQDLSGGTNIVTNPYVLGQRQSIRLTNLILDELGSLRTRPGVLIQTTAPAPGRRIVRVFDFVRVDGSIIPLAILRGRTGSGGYGTEPYGTGPYGGSGAAPSQLYNRGTTPWTFRGNFTTLEDIPDMLSFTDKVLIAHGYEVPKFFDGTTFDQLSASGPGSQSLPPGAKHHSLHLGFYWLWNTAAATNNTDGPSSLRSSDLNNPNSWPLANQVFIAKDDGQRGQGLATFTIAESGISPVDTQIAFKDFSSYQITGVFGADTFAIQKTKSDMGCVAPRTIQFCSGFGILRLTHRGVAQFDGVNDTLLSEEIRPLIFGGSGFTAIDWPNVGLSYATQVQNPPLYLLFCPTGGAGLLRVFCYDLVRQAWSVLQYPEPFSSVQLIADPGRLPIVLAGDFAEDLTVFASVRELFVDADLTDDCVAPGICWEAVLKPVGGNSPQTQGYFRRAIVKVINVIQGQTINWRAIFGPAVTAIPRQKTGTLTLPATVLPTAGSASGYGVVPYGTSPYGGGGPNTECDLTIDLGLIATNGRLILNGCGPIIIRGIEWHVQPKPVARPTVFA